jgi:hypothetical protein
MRDAKMTEVIGRSIKRTKDVLFRPFNLKKWLILIFIAIFAGSLSLSSRGGGGGNDSQKQKPAGVEQSASTSTSADAASGGDKASASSSGKQFDFSAWSKTPQSKVVFGIAAAAVIFFLVLTLVGIWVSSRFKFIWFNAVAANDASVIEPFHRHRIQGNSLFAASLVLSIIFIAALSAVVGWGVLTAYNAGAFEKGFAWSVPVAMQLFTLPVITAIILIIAGVILNVAIENFGVMVMALDKINFVPAMKRVAAIYGKNLGDIILVHIVMLLLGIACAVIAMIIAIAAIIAFLLIGVVIFGGGYGIIVAIMKLKIAFIIYCVLLGVPFLAVLLITMLCIQLPFSVFFRSFSIEYLLSLGCGYTPEMIAKYALEKSPNRSKSAVVVPVILIMLMMAVFMVGLLAAIAIPNFIKARETAMQRQAAAGSGGTFSSSYRTQ